MNCKQFVMRWPEGKPKALTLSYDDGVDTDERLIRIMEKYGIKGTFNINSDLYSPEGYVKPADATDCRLSYNQATKLYKSPVCEVACHALTHDFLDRLPSEAIIQQTITDRINLEKQFGIQVRGMAYPFGTYSEKAVECLRLCGIRYCRTTVQTEGFSLPKNWLTLHSTCHHNNPKLMDLAEQFLEYDKNKITNPLMFYLWGHSYEFARDNNWEVIENFCKKLSGKDDIWYATNIEIYNYQKAFEQLEYSADCSIIHNPTATNLWLSYGWSLKEPIKIPAGETVVLEGI